MIVDNMLLYFAHNDGNDKGTGRDIHRIIPISSAVVSKKRARCEAMEKRDDGGGGEEEHV